MTKAQQVVDALNAIIVRCEEGDKRFDWLPTIVSLAKKALAAQADAPAIQPQQMRAALERMVYEVTHLSPCEVNGSHKCKISAEALAKARAALAHTRPERGDEQ